MKQVILWIILYSMLLFVLACAYDLGTFRTTISSNDVHRLKEVLNDTD